jgi:WXXGXW repeat (2 copies)
MSHRTISVGLCGLILALTGPRALPAHFSFSVAVTPPAPLVETAPPPPVPGYVWNPGYWSWNGVKYVWVPGRYVVAPFPNARWIGGKWVHRGRRWAWVDGRWGHR